MKDTTGLELEPELCFAKYSAACSSATPPISPIKIMPLVSLSFKKTSRQSIKSVP